MKVQGNFKYVLDGVEIENFEKFEKAIKNINVEIEVNTNDLILYAKSV
jgi:hypothetical protein